MVERLMKPLAIVKVEVSAQALTGLANIIVIVQADFFVFDAAPQSLDEDVVQVSTASIHTDRSLPFFPLSSDERSSFF